MKSFTAHLIAIVVIFIVSMILSFIGLFLGIGVGDPCKVIDQQIREREIIYFDHEQNVTEWQPCLTWVCQIEERNYCYNWGAREQADQFVSKYSMNETFKCDIVDDQIILLERDRTGILVILSIVLGLVMCLTFSFIYYAIIEAIDQRRKIAATP